MWIILTNNLQGFKVDFMCGLHTIAFSKKFACTHIIYSFVFSFHFTQVSTSGLLTAK